MFLAHYEMNVWYVDDLVLAGLTSDQLRSVPAAGQNSVAWLLWHSTRWEDIWTNTWIRGQSQVIDRGNWLEQLNAEDRTAGTGWTPEDCAEFNRRVNCDALSLSPAWAAKPRTRKGCRSGPREPLTPVPTGRGIELPAQ
jgi:uncharacterized damage-inducible protein DinB